MIKSNLVSEEYSMAATEILEILKYFPKEITKQIPTRMIEFFNEVSLKDYKPQFDYSQGLENIKLADKTKALLAMLYRNYFCSEEERQKFDQKLYENEEKFQKQLREKYNPDYLFENKKEENNQKTNLIEYRERKWYHKIFEKIRQVFLKSN